MIALLSMLVVASASEVCPEAFSLSDWTRDLDRAEDRFAELEVGAFHAAMDAAAVRLPCLAEAVPPSLAARYHRLVGVALYARDDEEGARLAFAASRFVAPDADLEARLLPEGHEARTLFATATTPGERERVPGPAEGALLFDGTPSLERPLDRPTVAQVLGPDGTVRASGYLGVGDALLPYTPVAGGVRGASTPGQRRRQGARWAGLGVGIAAGAATGLLYGLATASAQRFDDDTFTADYTHADLLAHRRRTNDLVLGSGAAGAVAVAGITTFVALR